MRNESLFEEIKKKMEEEKEKNLIENRISQRNQFFEKNADISSIRNEIHSNEISLRKSNRNEEFENRRRFTTVLNDTSLSMRQIAYFTQELKEKYEEIQTKNENLESYIENLKSNNLEEKYFGIIAIRKLLAQRIFPFNLDRNAPTNQVINSGLVPVMLELMNDNIIEFQYEALWCLTNISSGDAEDTYSIISKNGIELIMKKFESNIAEIQEQSIWVIGNIAGESSAIRDKIIKQGCVEKLVFFLKTAERVQLVKNCLWALSNFCRGKPAPDYEIVKPVLDLVIKAINNHSNDTDLITDGTWILSYMSENYKKTIPLIISSKILPKIVSFLNIKILHLQIQCTRIISNISTCDSAEVQAIIDSGMIPYLKILTFHERPVIRKETCLIISNIAAGTDLQTELLIKNDFIKILGTIIKNDNEDVQKEAIFALANLTTVEKPHVAKIIFEENILEFLCFALKSSKNDVLLVTLEALNRLLEYGKSYFLNENGKNPVVEKMMKMNKVIDRLEELQMSQSQKVYEAAVRIIENYFANETAN